MLSYAFQVTDQDVAAVLEAYRLRLLEPDGRTFQAIAEELLLELDVEVIAKAALDAGDDMNDQTVAAHAAIHEQLVSLGVLDF